MDNLKKQLKEHFQSKALSEGQFQSLERIQEQKNWYYQFNFSMPMAASFIIIFIIGLTNFIGQSKTTLQLIAGEVIYNHKKNLPSEFLVDKMSDLNNRLIKLDFQIKDSPSLASHEVIGGRYCSIQGLNAAQIKIKKDKKVSTLYQSNFSAVDKKDLPFELIKDDVKVEIWIEDKILHAKATNIIQ